jgi:hypothetical protein
LSGFGKLEADLFATAGKLIWSLKLNPRNQAMFNTQEHADLRNTVAKFVDQEINPFVDEWEAAKIFPAHELFKKLGNLGLLGISKPDAFGGMGLDYSFAIAFAEELGRVHCGGIPMAIGVQTDMATPALAHIGFAEGIVAIDGILGEDPVGVDYHSVPWCIYCSPEVAFSGYSEAAAKEAGFDVVTSKHRFAGNGRAMIVGETDGLVKVIAEREDDGTGGRILGVHMVGPWVTEQLGQGYLAVNWEATAAEVARFIQPHPTMSELFGETVMSLTGRSLHG